MAFRYMVLKNGWLIFNYGTGIANFRASTGRPGISDPSIENHGPIPPGRYIIIPSEINDVDYTKYKIRVLYVRQERWRNPKIRTVRHRRLAGRAYVAENQELPRSGSQCES